MFQMSPLGNQPQHPKGQGVPPVAAAGAPGANQDDPPKIRVVVRKRPISRKVRMAFANLSVLGPGRRQGPAP